MIRPQAPCKYPRASAIISLTAAALVSAAAVGACGPAQDRETRIGVGEKTPDANGLPQDGGRPDGATFRRPDEPRLPPAEQTVIVPYMDTARVVLKTSSALRRLDVLFNVDTTGSMDGEIERLQSSLLSTIIPALRERVADVAFGVSRFEDFPRLPYGAEGRSSVSDRADEPFTLLTPITLDERALQSAVLNLDRPLGWGGDGPESGFEALYQVATGAGFRFRSRTYIDSFEPNSDDLGTIGGAGFRDRALPAVVQISDAPSHVPVDYRDDFAGVRGREDALSALHAIGARVIGISSSHSSFAELSGLALATGGVIPARRGDECPNGEPSDVLDTLGDYGCVLSFHINEDGSGLSETIVNGIAALVETLLFTEVRAVVGADPNGMIQRIVPLPPKAAEDAPAPGLADRRPLGAPDGVFDTYTDVARGSQLTFEITLRNDRIAPAATEQSFRVLIQVLGDGWVVEERLIRVVVPPWPADGGRPPPNTLDGGLPDASPYDGQVAAPTDGGPPATDGSAPDAPPQAPDGSAPPADDAATQGPPQDAP